jgi:tetratricopeptide (TPR) repeat protein
MPEREEGEDLLLDIRLSGPLPNSDAPVEEDASPLPLLGWGDEGEGGAPQPLLEVGQEETAARGTGRGPSETERALERAAEEAGSERRRPPSTPEEAIAAGDLSGAEGMIRDLMAREPTELSHRQRLVEVAYRRGDPRAQAEAYVELARCLERGGSAAQAEGVYQQALHLDPENAAARAALAESGRSVAADVAAVASTEDYVDLGSLIFGDEQEEKSTRFLVEYEEPTGDEQADFARMLSQFKAKIAQNVAADDVRAHHDLGTAYKEMGLLDEAIEEFQAALRASRDHLPTYELLGQCFLAKGQPEAALKSLQRALALPIDVEDELLGIYYFLGRAYERTGDKESAVEYYDRVFSLDINFMDVTERLRALR